MNINVGVRTVAALLDQFYEKRRLLIISAPTAANHNYRFQMTNLQVKHNWQETDDWWELMLQPVCHCYFAAQMEQSTDKSNEILESEWTQTVKALTKAAELTLCLRFQHAQCGLDLRHVTVVEVVGTYPAQIGRIRHTVLPPRLALQLRYCCDSNHTPTHPLTHNNHWIHKYLWSREGKYAFRTL